MQRDLEALAEGVFDLIVIGGGMFGAAVALDAAQRGLRTALVERGDFCGATSAHSFKMLHGGIRYLQHANVRRIRQSSAARGAFLRVAPHLAHSLPIVIPTYGSGMKSKPVLRAGMALYDGLTLGRNRGIADPSRRIPPGWFLGRDEVRRRFPGLPTEGLTGAGVFCDGQMYNPARLVLAFIQSAAAQGAVCANHVEATGLVVRAGRVEAVAVQDQLTGARFDVQARMVVNAAGPYAQRILAGALGSGLTPPTPFSRDAYFIVPRPVLDGDHALTVPSRTRDSEAMVSRGSRHLFLVPWRGVTLVGVWHKVYPGDPDRYEITEAELERWIAEINEAYPAAQLNIDEVALGSAGLVPFGEHDPAAQSLKFAHSSRIVDHAAERQLEGLITLIGVRYTTGPADAVEVVDLAGRHLGRDLPRSRLAWTPVRGGDFADFEALVREIAQSAPPGTDAAAVRALAHNHGSAYAEVLALSGSRPDLGQPLAATSVLRAEIVHAMQEEMAASLADVVFRRTDLCTAGFPSLATLREAAEVMAGTAGWTSPRMAAELDYVLEKLALARTGRALLADGSLPRRTQAPEAALAGAG
jgi:glycerol-3-phosphate dehydrogenase